ncbi:MAG: nuclear transport factor 2 family protein [Gemmatimonadaceae bacterium]
MSVRQILPVFGFLITACAVQGKPPQTSDAKAIVQGYVRAWNQHDSAAFDTLLASDGTHDDFALDFHGKGPKQVTEFMRGMISAEPDYNWRVTRIAQDGQTVALEWTWSAKYTGPDPNGKPVRDKATSGRGASIVEVQDGKIKRFADYYDMASFFK